MNNEQVNERNNEQNIYDPEDIFDLPLGEALTMEETYSITGKSMTKLIVFAGPSECGKTTLITTIYQLFHKGSVGEYYFAGSQTLKGFEQRAFHTRTNSGMRNANTQRTRIGSIDSFLHLKLWDSKKMANHTFLLADFSGEDFKNARANVELMREDFSVIKRADFLVVIIDGNSITQKDLRFSTIQTTQELLRTMRDAEVLRENTEICFVVSKSDIVNARCDEDPSLKNYVDDIPNKFKNVFNSIKNEIRFYNVAAMPKNTEIFPIGYGIENLIRSWAKENQKTDGGIFNEDKSFTSEFNRFNHKILGGK